MAKTKSSPEDIFFSSIVKKQPENTSENDINSNTSHKIETSQNEYKPIIKNTKKPAEKTTQLNVPITVELKYELETLVSELKQKNPNNRYFIKNFIVEAIEEKIAREKLNLR